LWHERDISHSSVERVIGPDATITLDFALHRLAEMMDNLVVYPNNMRNQIDKFGGIHDAQRVLLYLTQKNLSREDAYQIVQRNAMKVWKTFGIDQDNSDGAPELTHEERQATSFDNRLMYFLSKDEKILEVLTKDELSELSDSESLDYHLSGVEIIFERVFG